jgi:hypothetical protein
MQNSSNATVPAQLGEVGKRRAGLRRAITALEESASAALAGRPAEWRARLAPCVDNLQVAWESHISGTEGPGGLWEQIRTDAPRLNGQLNRLGREHQSLTAEVAALKRGLADAGEVESRLASVRERVTTVLVQLARHRQRGADLIYEAYERDIGGNG